MAALLDDDQHLPSLIAEARRLKKKHKKKDKKKRKPTPAAPASAPTDPSPAPSPTPSMAVLCTDALLKHRAGTRLASSSAPTGSQIQRIKKAPAPAASAPAPTDPSPTPSPAPMLAPSPTPPSPDDLWLQRHVEARLWQQQVSFFLFRLSYNSRSCLSGLRYHCGDFPERIPWDSGLRLKKLVAALPLRPS